MDFRIFSLGSNDQLAQAIASHIGVSLGEINCRVFADGEQHIQFKENLRNKSVFLIQSTNGSGDNWIRLLLAIDAARGASAHDITVVIPYFGYARQDRKVKPREPISARVFATILERVGATRVLTMDMHNDAIVGFFRKATVDHLYARPVFLQKFKEYFKDTLDNDDLVVVSPDAGGVVRAQAYAKRLMKTADLAMIHKEREIPNQIARMKLIGDVKDKIALIIDDMSDTCGTLVTAARVLKDYGAREVYAATTHGVLSKDANKIIDESLIQKLFITDTITTARTLSSKIDIVSVAPIFGDAIARMEHGESLSELFEIE